MDDNNVAGVAATSSCVSAADAAGIQCCQQLLGRHAPVRRRRLCGPLCPRGPATVSHSGFAIVAPGEVGRVPGASESKCGGRTDLCSLRICRTQTLRRSLDEPGPFTGRANALRAGSEVVSPSGVEGRANLHRQQPALEFYCGLTIMKGRIQGVYVSPESMGFEGPTPQRGGTVDIRLRLLAVARLPTACILPAAVPPRDNAAEAVSSTTLSLDVPRSYAGSRAWHRIAGVDQAVDGGRAIAPAS
jgi:hypothetical protein